MGHRGAKRGDVPLLMLSYTPPSAGPIDPGLGGDILQRRVNSTDFGRNPHHGAITGTDLEKFPEPLKHALLKVRKVVLVTERLNFRLDLLVLRHGKVRNQMVLNLVIEPHLGIVYPVASGLVVHRSQYLIHVKLLFVFVVVVEAEEVRTGVIGSDDHVGVEVRDELGQHSIDKHEQHRGFSQREKEERDDDKMEREKGQVT